MLVALTRSVPDDGARGVPIDQAPVLEGYFAASSVRWEDASGAAIAFDLNQGPMPGCPSTWAELVPKSELAPNTEYVIRVEPDGSYKPDPAEKRSISFTTGEQRSPDSVLAMPVARASMVRAVPPSVVECGIGATVMCLWVPDSNGVEILARRGDEIVLRWLLPRIDDGSPLDGSVVLSRDPDCVEFRRRSQTGQRSQPLVLCGDALGTRSYRESDSGAHGLLCREGMFGEPAPMVAAQAGASARVDAPPPQVPNRGCSACAGRGEEPVLWMVVTAVVVARGARRRRERRVEK